jgi:UDP-N-acetylglucosamine acyltransferase
MGDGIHSTAIVERGARIGAGVTIGAYSIVGGAITLEDGVEIGHHVVLEGTVLVAAGAKIGHGSVIGAPPQDLKYRDGTPSGVRIGPRTVIREHVTIHRATTPEAWTEVGADGLIMSASHIAHDCRVGAGVIVINYAGIAGHCEIGDRATIGGFAGLHPFTRVGEQAYIGGLAKVVSDVPPFLLVDGVPATARGVNVIGLRRAGMPPADRRALQEAYRVLYRSGLGPGSAVERLRADLGSHAPVARLVEFIAGSKRGICGPPRGADVDDETGVAPSPGGERL